MSEIVTDEMVERARDEHFRIFERAPSKPASAEIAKAIATDAMRAALEASGLPKMVQETFEAQTVALGQQADIAMCAINKLEITERRLKEAETLLAPLAAYAAKLTGVNAVGDSCPVVAWTSEQPIIITVGLLRRIATFLERKSDEAG